MSYIDNTLMQGEIVLYRARPHWIIFAKPVFWLIVTVLIFLYGPHYPITSYRIQGGIALYSIAGYVTLFLTLIYALTAFIVYQSSEYGITNKRVLMKVGLIQRLSLEIFLQRVEGIKVYQSIFGRLFNYGSIVISGIGGSKDPFHRIPDPLAFRGKVQEQLEKMTPLQQTHIESK